MKRKIYVKNLEEFRKGLKTISEKDTIRSNTKWDNDKDEYDEIWERHMGVINKEYN